MAQDGHTYCLEAPELSFLDDLIREREQQLKEAVQRSRPTRRVRGRELPALLEEVAGHVHEFLQVPPVELPKIRKYCPYRSGGPHKEVMRSMRTIKNALAGTSAASSGMSVFALDLPPLNASACGTIFFGLGLGVALHARRMQQAIESYHPDFYRPSDKSMHILLGARSKVISSIAHEYGHHLEDECGVAAKHQIFLTEGFCRRLQMRIGGTYAAMEDNPVFLVDPLQLEVADLRRMRRILDGSGETPTRYEWGTLAFNSLERELGTQACRRYLANDLPVRVRRRKGNIIMRYACAPADGGSVPRSEVSAARTARR